MSEFEKKVPVITSIRENATGEVISYEDVETLTEKGFDIQQWTEGNFGCDCNREIFFNNHHAKISLDHEKDEIHHDCGVGKYFVNIINKETKEVYFQQFPITETQKIKEYAYKECFTSLFESLPKINLDMMILQGEVKPNIFMFRNVAAYGNLSCKMTVQFEFKNEK